MSAHIYIEGAASGDNSKAMKIVCQKAFNQLLLKMGFQGRMPRLTACGGRGNAFNRFTTAHSRANAGDFIAMLVDSEDPVENVEETWRHLQSRDQWKKPAGAVDEQALLMTRCMETWIVVDRNTLKQHYGDNLQENALPSLDNLENIEPHDLEKKLCHATRNCTNVYAKGRRSFDLLAKLNPAALQRLPSFARIARILNQKM